MEAEKEILKLYSKNTLKSDILKVAHHGSKNSSSEEFLKAISPKIALIGVGENNTFGNQNTSVLKRLEAIKCKIYRTDELGEIKLEL